MGRKILGREEIIGALAPALRRSVGMLALWEAGAVSFGRFDEWSDIDMYIVAEDSKVEEAFRLTERALRELSPIDLKYRVPASVAHEYEQTFYRLKLASPYLFIDLAVMKRSAGEKFLEFAIHGKPVVHFDKLGIVKEKKVDRRAFLKKVHMRLVALKTLFPLFRVLVLKELNRGNDLEAFGYYMGGPYKYLVEALRMRYGPLHWDFQYRYIHYELPKAVAKKLVKLTYIPDAKELRKRLPEAERLFWSTVKGLRLSLPRDR
jgi:predicted nucleotidyltransferase